MLFCKSDAIMGVIGSMIRKPTYSTTDTFQKSEHQSHHFYRSLFSVDGSDPPSLNIIIKKVMINLYFTRLVKVMGLVHIVVEKTFGLRYIKSGAKVNY